MYTIKIQIRWDYEPGQKAVFVVNTRTCLLYFQMDFNDSYQEHTVIKALCHCRSYQWQASIGSDIDFKADGTEPMWTGILPRFIAWFDVTGPQKIDINK